MRHWRVRTHGGVEHLTLPGLGGAASTIWFGVWYGWVFLVGGCVPSILNSEDLFQDDGFRGNY